jgi:replicative DNA helicase
VASDSVSAPDRIYDPAGAADGSPGESQLVSAKGEPEAIDQQTHAPFPIDCLPPAAAEMAKAVCAAERVPESLAGSCVLAILSASIGHGLEVKSGPDRLARSNLFIVAGAESASGKSETLRHIEKPFRQFERDRIKRWSEETQPAVKTEVELLSAELGELKKRVGKAGSSAERDEIREEFKLKQAKLQETEEATQPPILTVEDLTTEKLAFLLSKNRECITSISSDAGVIINNLLGRYSKLDRTDEAIYLKGWTGEYHRVDRIGRDSIALTRPWISALWLVQPDKIATLLETQALVEGGLLPRLLICQTGCQPRRIIEGAQGIPPAAARSWRKLVRKLLQTYRLAKRPSVIEPISEAMAVFNNHYNAIVDRWNVGELRDVSSFALRWTEQSWRIAVCVHAGIHGKRAKRIPLEVSTAQRALAIADWFAQQQLQILSESRSAAARKATVKIFELLGKTPGGIRPADVYRARIARDATEARTILTRMEAEHALLSHDRTPPGGGHVTRFFFRNPAYEFHI